MAWRKQPAIKAGTIGGRPPRVQSDRTAKYGPTPEPKTRLGFRDEQPGNVHAREAERSAYYANPPSNLGLNGLQLDTDVNKRRGYVRNGVVGVPATPFHRKREPFV